MPYDLRTEAWIPFLRRNGTVEWGAPSLLTDDLTGGNPIIDVAPPRPDFRGALLEFLIGLMTVALQPADEEEWRQFWDDPPPPEELAEWLTKLPEAFNLDGDGPRFFQDQGPLDADPKPIAGIFIDMPGDQTLKNNADLFQRGIELRLGLPMAAMALIAKQTYSPAGGAGYRTGLRGGGPLTTLVDPQDLEGGERAPLWQKIWANVPLVPDPHAASDIPPIFPWMAPTRQSNPKKGGAPTYPADGHELQQFFTLPCRIRLVFEAGEGRCDLAGEVSPALVRAFETVPYGVQYMDWPHALSPHYAPKPGEPGWLPLHGRTGGIGWRDWAGLIFGQKKSVKKGKSETPLPVQQPAGAVSTFLNERASFAGAKRLTLHTFGYDMDNAKAREWTEGRMPLWPVSDPAQADELSQLAAKLTEKASNALSALRQAYRTALYDHVHDKPSTPPTLDASLWAETEAPFFDAVRALAENPEAESEDAQDAFERKLRAITLTLFDGACPFTLARRPQQQVEARTALRWKLRTMREGEAADAAKAKSKRKLKTEPQGELSV